MNPFNSVRRDLLRVGSLGMAGAALPALASAAGPSAAVKRRARRFPPPSSTSASTAPPATAKLSTPTPSIAPSQQRRQPGAARFFSRPAFISAFPFICRATFISISTPAPPSSPPSRPSPAKPPATTAELMTQPNPIPHGTPTRTTATITGTTPSSGLRTCTTSPSPARASSMERV